MENRYIYALPIINNNKGFQLTSNDLVKYVTSVNTNGITQPVKTDLNYNLKA